MSESHDPTPQDVKAAIGLLKCIADGSDLTLEPIQAEALIRHINSLYIKGFNFGLRSVVHAMDLAKERAHSEAAGIDTEEADQPRPLRPKSTTPNHSRRPAGGEPMRQAR